MPGIDYAMGLLEYGLEIPHRSAAAVLLLESNHNIINI